jgi:hypothetical protein
MKKGKMKQILLVILFFYVAPTETIAQMLLSMINSPVSKTSGYELWESSQASKNSVDTIQIRVTIQKSVRYPKKARDGHLTGATLFQLEKVNDSIKVESLYSSSREFDLAQDKYFLSAMNGFARSIPNSAKLIIPLYFTLETASTTKKYSQENQKDLEKKLQQLKVKPSMSILPSIVITGYVQ